jgi:hypothetical protein
MEEGFLRSWGDHLGYEAHSLAVAEEMKRSDMVAPGEEV